MCGVFGFVSRTPTPMLVLDNMAIDVIDRGNRAWGFTGYNVKTNRWVTRRTPKPFTRDDSFVTDELPETRIAIGHLRAPTTSQSTDSSDVHPFETARFSFAMNGLVLEEESIRKWIYPGMNTIVDTAAILCRIDMYVTRQGVSIPSAIETTMRELYGRGQFACALVDTWELKTYIWRVMSPLFVNAGDNLLTFGSSLPKPKTIDPKWKVVEGEIIQLDPTSRTPTLWTVVGHFPLDRHVTY